MKLILKRDLFEDSIAIFLRNAGYLNIYDKRLGKESYVRTFMRGHYPRFHLYIKEDSLSYFLDLHLDHKQASYEGNHMHNAEYDGDLVEAEINRLASLAGITPSQSRVEPGVGEEEKVLPTAYLPKEPEAREVKPKFSGKPLTMGHGSLDDFLTPLVETKKKPWWKIF